MNLITKWCMYQVVPCCAKKFQQSSLAFGHEGPKGRGAHMCSLISMFGWLNEWRNDWLNHKLNSWIGHWRMHEWMIKGSRTSVRLLLPGKLLLLAISSLIILAKSSLKPAPSPRNFALGQLSSELFPSLGQLFFAFFELLFLWASSSARYHYTTWYHSALSCILSGLFLSKLLLLWATSSLSYLFSELTLQWSSSSLHRIFSELRVPLYPGAFGELFSKTISLLGYLYEFPLQPLLWATSLMQHLLSEPPLLCIASTLSPFFLSYIFSVKSPLAYIFSDPRLLLWAASSVKHSFSSKRLRRV